MKLLVYYVGDRLLENDALGDMFIIASTFDESIIDANNFETLLFRKLRKRHFIIGKTYVVKRKGRKGNYGYVVTGERVDDEPPISKKLIQKWSAIAANARTVSQTAKTIKKIRAEHADAWKDCLGPIRRAYLEAGSWRERKALLMEVQTIITGRE